MSALASPADLPRGFSNAWSTHDAREIASLFAEDADLMSLTGTWAEGRKAIGETFAAELAGTFARAKLVTGRTKLRSLGPDTVVVLQRYVLSGLLHADGADAGRIGTILAAVLSRGPEGWRIVSAQFAIEG
ncbi:MAG: SgcJ/EcaC family oxidoreductase [Defluviimonas sp.]|uniref:YybH family protein n=1 Tax=Albidovulum sp. TaxID=1872424 RepID=UPI001E0FF7E5|nr:SgcJ/EcaC family oxidoreductase [Paracoccaceae bacterium]MCC0064892.1 SgcJ/EcaC family oxidoreductase [Defluviimonas sp.]